MSHSQLKARGAPTDNIRITPQLVVLSARMHYPSIVRPDYGSLAFETRFEAGLGNIHFSCTYIFIFYFSLFLCPSSLSPLYTSMNTILIINRSRAVALVPGVAAALERAYTEKRSVIRLIGVDNELCSGNSRRTGRSSSSRRVGIADRRLDSIL